jgi:hypothetical protein
MEFEFDEAESTPTAYFAENINITRRSSLLRAIYGSEKETTKIRE